MRQASSRVRPLVVLVALLVVGALAGCSDEARQRLAQDRADLLLAYNALHEGYRVHGRYTATVVDDAGATEPQLNLYVGDPDRPEDYDVAIEVVGPDELQLGMRGGDGEVLHLHAVERGRDAGVRVSWDDRLAPAGQGEPTLLWRAWHGRDPRPSPGPIRPASRRAPPRPADGIPDRLLPDR